MLYLPQPHNVTHTRKIVGKLTIAARTVCLSVCTYICQSHVSTRLHVRKLYGIIKLTLFYYIRPSVRSSVTKLVNKIEIDFGANWHK